MNYPFHRYKKLLWSRASHFHKSNPHIPLEDLESEANLSFILACKSFNNRKSRFTTYLYRVVNNNLINYVKEVNKGKEFDEISPELPSHTVSPYEMVKFKESLTSLSAEAQEVCSLIFDTPSELTEMLRDEFIDSSHLVGGISKYLRKQGWKYKTIWNVMKELRQFVNN